MPRPCLRPDPVELLLRSILRRSALWAAAVAATACSEAHAPAELERQEPDEGEAADAFEDAADGDGDASTGADTGVAGEVSVWDAGGVDAAAGFATLRGPPEIRLADAGALGPALACEGARPQGSFFHVPAAALKPAEKYDYLALRRRYVSVQVALTDAGADSWTTSDFEVLSETGTKCASASDAGCAEKIAHHPAQFVFTSRRSAFGGSELSAVTTRGNSVLRWAGEASVSALLGEIDSGEEALLLVAVAGYDLECGDAEATSWRSVPEGYEVYATRPTSTCAPYEITRYHLRVSKRGEVGELGSLVFRQLNGCAGRKPAGLLSRGREIGRSKLGDYLAGIAHLEAASVVSFERLARELAAFGAPRPLIDAALAARADEVRHADLIGRLALLNGGEPVEPTVAALPPRKLEEVALENAVEGCVRETFGALVGGYQAEHACNGALRVAMARIAQDEARHAALSHLVHRWIIPRLDAAAAERVRHAQQRAVFELAAEIAVAPDAELASVAGLPSPEVANTLLSELSKTLWRSALRPRRAGAARA